MKNAEGGAKLFCLPDLEEPLDLFDSEDLLPDRVFLLVEGDSDSARSGTIGAEMLSSKTATAAETVRAWLWVGAEAAFDPARDQEAVRAQVLGAFNLQPGQLQLSVEVSFRATCTAIAATVLFAPLQAAWLLLLHL